MGVRPFRRPRGPLATANRTSPTRRGSAVTGILTALLATAITACAAFPSPTVGNGGRSTASMNTALSIDDIRLADGALLQALETAPDGAGTTWTNPQTGSSGAYRIVQTFQDSFGRPCRGYQELVQVRGAQEGFTVSACRDQVGRWVRLEAL